MRKPSRSEKPKTKKPIAINKPPLSIVATKDDQNHIYTSTRQRKANPQLGGRRFPSLEGVKENLQADAWNRRDLEEEEVKYLKEKFYLLPERRENFFLNWSR